MAEYSSLLGSLPQPQTSPSREGCLHGGCIYIWGVRWSKAAGGLRAEESVVVVGQLNIDNLYQDPG